MTEGRPVRLIVMFALPLMFGNIFQQLYSVVDSMIVGRNLGVSALAALGAYGSGSGNLDPARPLIRSGQ